MLNTHAGSIAPGLVTHGNRAVGLPALPAKPSLSHPSLPRPSLPRPSLAGVVGGRVLFVDPGVADAASLLAGAGPGVHAWLLDSEGCGVEQMARVMAGYTGLSGVCVIAHGSSGSLRLGSGRLDCASLAAQGPALAAIGAAIAPGGVLALHGCHVAAGAPGRALVDGLARRTGVTVAAASHLVGGAAGASWELDVLCGPAGCGDARGATLPLVDAEALRGYAHTLSGASPPPPGYPLTITNFGTPSASGSFILTGSASVSGAALTLTPDRTGQTGLAIYDAPISPQNAVTIQFTYDSSGGNGTAPNPSGGDGIALFLLNGDLVGAGGGLSGVQPGSFGGGLGYSDTGSSTGITDGFLAIGFDTYGNFAGTSGHQSTGVGPITGGSGGGVAPDTVVIRGEGDSTTGYTYVGSAAYAPGIDGSRDVQVNLSQTGPNLEEVDVYMRPTGSGQAFAEVLSTTVTQTLPGQLYFGLSSGTGGYDDLHRIDSVAVTLPVALALGAPIVDDLTTGTVNPTLIHPGDSFDYTYTVANNGPNADSEIMLGDLLPANIEAGGYTVTDSAGSHSGTGGAIGVNLALGGVATIVVSGTVNPNATPGNANHTVTVSAGAAFASLDPNASTTIDLPIGPAGSSVSLVDANGTASATGIAPTRPLAAALVIDTYADPAPGALPDTLSVAIAPSAGTLSVAGAPNGASYDAATGILSAAGTAAQLQAILDGVTFTPSAAATPLGTTRLVPITVNASDPNAADPGGGGNTATQTKTVQVTPVHDTPSVTGGTAGLPVAGSATAAPFGGLAVADPDDTSLAATVTILGGASGHGSFTAASSAGWTATASGNDLVYTRSFAAQPDIGAAAQAGIGALVFQPGPLAAETGASVATGFAVTVTDGLGLASVADTLASVIDTPAGGLLPFLPLSATGPDASQIITVTAALPPGTDGRYSRLGGGFIAPDGLTYVVSGTDAQVTAALHAVTFTPADPAITTLPENFTALVVGAASATTLTDVGTGNSMLVAGSGSDTVTSGIGTDNLYGSAGSSVLLGGGGDDLFVASTGDSTVFAGAGNAMVYGNTGPLVFVNSASTATVFTGSGFAGVFGGTGTLQAYGGAGGGVFYGGTAGNNILVAGNGATSILGGGDGDRLTTNSAAPDVLAAGQGNETLSGTGSSGNDLYFAGGGNALIAAGSGSSLVMAGSGRDSVFTGATGSATIFGAGGSTLVVEGRGTATFAAGSGSATVDGGSGADLVSIVDGHAGGSLTINDFKPGTDQVGLFGYAQGQLAQALASAVTAGGSTTLTLSDQTRLVFSGFTTGQLAGSVLSSS